jgi:hypothetical protein
MKVVMVTEYTKDTFSDSSAISNPDQHRDKGENCDNHVCSIHFDNCQQLIECKLEFAAPATKLFEPEPSGLPLMEYVKQGYAVLIPWKS